MEPNTTAPPEAGELSGDLHTLLQALDSLLLPLAQLCVGKGVPIQAAEERLRRAFVEAARRSSDGANPQRLTSRISTLTGLTRREVARIQAKTQEIIRKALSWEQMRPVYLDVYKKTYTREDVRAITKFYESAAGQRMLDKNPALEASIRLRLPYIEPLNLLQIELMKRHRAGETDPRIAEGIQLTINAIATALRNSG